MPSECDETTLKMLIEIICPLALICDAAYKAVIYWFILEQREPRNILDVRHMDYKAPPQNTPPSVTYTV